MIAVSISTLSNADLFAFVSQVNNILSDTDADIPGIELYVNNFTERYIAYKESYENTSAFAEQVLVKDTQRDDYFIALTTHIKNFKHHPDPKFRKKADELVAILNKEGNKVYQLSHNSETAALQEIIKTVDANYLPDMELLGALVWYNLLKEVEAEFELIMNDYVEKKKKTVKLDAATGIRKELESSVRKLLTFLPMQFELTHNETLGQLVDQLQQVAYKF